MGHVVTAGARFHLGLGDCLDWCGLRAAARQAFGDALRADPDSAEAHSRLAESLGSDGRWREAAAHLQAAVQLLPHDPEIHGNLVLALARAEQWTAAVAAIDALIRVRPHDAEPHVLRGALLLKVGRRAEAIRSFRWAVRLPRGPEWRRFFLGETLLGRDAWRAALDSYALARALEPDAVASEAGSSPLNGHPGDPMLDPSAGSERAMRAAGRRAPRAGVGPIGRALAAAHQLTARLEFGLGLALARRGPHRTLRRLRAAHGRLRLPQPVAVAWLAMLLALAAAFSRGESLEARDRARVCFSVSGETAIAACRGALELGLQHDRAHMALRVLAAELAAREQWDEMVEAYRALVRLRPEDAEARHRLGRALLLVQDQAAAAERELRRAVELAGREPRYRGWLGTALNELGRYAEAVEELELAGVLDDRYFEAHPAAAAVLEASRAARRWP